MACGKLIVISAPSGAGKTTIAARIRAWNPELGFSVSATTRPMRAGEQEGREYYFLSVDEFKKRMESGEFVEWEFLYSNYYGTLQKEIDRALTTGEHLLFDVDVNGGLSIKKRFPDALLVFIKPPSIDTLRERLAKRMTEDESALARRLERVPMELAKGEGYDAIVINDDLDIAVEEVKKIIRKHLER
jgi:guanylate kinase